MAKYGSAEPAKEVYERATWGAFWDTNRNLQYGRTNVKEREIMTDFDRAHKALLSK